MDRTGLSPLEEALGEDGVGGAPGGFGVRRGGSLPPGTYLKPESMLFCLNLSVSRLPTT